MSHVAGYVAALALVAVAVWSPGCALERVLSRGRPGMDGVPTDLRSLARWCLGVGFWVVALFLLATLGALRPGPLAAVLALAVASGLATRWLAPRRSHPVHRPSRPRPTRPTNRLAPRAAPSTRLATAILAASVVAMALVPLPITVNPTVSWDASAYHLTLPRLYLEHGGFRPVPMNVYSNWPLAVELLFAPALLAGGPPVAKLVHYGFGLLVLWGLWLAGRRVGSPAWARWLAMAMFLGNGVVLFELRVAYVDLALAFFLLATFLFLAAARDERFDGDGPPRRRSQASLLLAGVAGGLAAGVKVTGILGVAVVASVWLPRWLSDASRFGVRRATAPLLRFALPVAVLGLPWLARSAWLTGNPVYPFAWEVFGGPDWSAELGERFADWQRGLGMGRRPLDWLLLLPRVIFLGVRGYDRFDGELGAFWILVLPLAVIFARRSAWIRRTLGVAGLYFVVWGLSSQQARFLIPALPLVAVAGAAATRRLADRWPVVVLVAALVVPSGFVAGHGGLVEAAGRHLEVYSDPRFDPERAMAPSGVWRAIDELPPDAKVLMVGTNQGFFCRREYLADSFFEASQVADWLRTAVGPEATAARLRARGVTHVLRARRDWGVDYPAGLVRLMRDPHSMRVVYTDPGHVLLELSRSPGGSRVGAGVETGRSALGPARGAQLAVAGSCVGDGFAKAETMPRPPVSSSDRCAPCSGPRASLRYRGLAIGEVGEEAGT